MDVGWTSKDTLKRNILSIPSNVQSTRSSLEASRCLATSIAYPPHAHPTETSTSNSIRVREKYARRTRDSNLHPVRTHGCYLRWSSVSVRPVAVVPVWWCGVFSGREIYQTSRRTKRERRDEKRPVQPPPPLAQSIRVGARRLSLWRGASGPARKNFSTTSEQCIRERGGAFCILRHDRHP